MMKTRFYVHSNTIYFTVEPPYCYLYESDDSYFLLLATADSGKYLILGDKLYEEDENVDVFKKFS
jgi:hypothetical protein